ncbi:sugar phosphate isomerase/epimerase family protein [Streptomyces sp. uw30]|uniref:sugar phosphate isomerase/epimerase family protein n=1 Tax=Streptomyces sp. uw30 TaxID=1828179 RepID=UPI0021C69E05|nr:TIM barrel protein [Streptomyces sp. uw30]
MDRITRAQLTERGTRGESTATVADRVRVARERASARLAGTPWLTNSEIPGRELRSRWYAAIGAMDEAERNLERGVLTARGLDRVLRVAWTVADLGYDGVGLTLDHMHLDPLAPDLAARTHRLAQRLDALGLDVTVETGARYVLDPRRKHGPSLLDPDPDDRARRVDLLIRAVRVAADLGAHAVHCFSGITPPGTDTDTAWHRLTDALTPVLDAATTAGVPLAVEPEPGHLLATLADFYRLRRMLGDPEPLGLTLDIGHCQCLEPLSPADCIRAAAPWLRHVQIEDMRRGIHEHLPFGDGEIDFPPVLAALSATGYQGLTVVELPRHSHAGPHFAERSLPFLRSAEATSTRSPVLVPRHGDPSATPEGSTT